MDEVLGVEDLSAGLTAATEGLPVGTILASILPPKAFLDQALPKGAWVEANGDPIPSQGSKLATFIKLNRDTFYDDRMIKKDVALTPDLRGAFLRGIDTGRGRAEGDPDPNRKIGNYQKDAFQRHSHQVGFATLTIEYDKGVTLPVSNPHPAAFPTSDAGDASETRPRNVAIYYYLRIA